ncbi:hypothetical protein C5610_11385 [Idiomarina sp. OT37-5b]|uniref:LysR family transcriptional regulator n=1 Tax=Idiomarina sp. OT37-5b TaxID=2100422 RepID=UPI000CF914F2|nr:LysR family transcriptional regulator [Idiomarina sp. OT37-5b]AVJ56831.1 hypothetical protein C5610_11385 [Idiomarina sp. OT37-5b]
MFERLSDMATFAAVAEATSFTRAAEQLGVTKGSVSKAVNRLESHLGVKLLRRTTRRLSLTGEGEQFLRHCQVIVSEAQLAEEHMGEYQSEPKGTVSVSAPVNFGAAQVAPHIDQLLSKFPHLNIHLTLSDEVVAFKEQDVDIAIRCGELRDSALYYRRLKPLRHVVVASPAYLNRFGEPASPEELSVDQSSHWCIPRNPSALGSRWHFYRGGEEVTVPVRGRFFSNENRAIKQAARNGLGIAFLPEYSVAELLESGELKQLLNAFMPPPIPVSLLFATRQYASSAVNETINFLEQKLG